MAETPKPKKIAPVKKAAVAKKAAAPSTTIKGGIARAQDQTRRVAPGGSVKRSISGDVAKSPAQRLARKMSDKGYDLAVKHDNRAIAAEDQGMRLRAATSNAKAKAVARGSWAAEKAVTSNGAGAKAFRTAAKVGKVAGKVGKFARVAGPVGAAVAAYDVGSTLANSKKLKSAAAGSRAATRAAAGGYLPKGNGPANVYASGTNAKSDAAKPIATKKAASGAKWTKASLNKAIREYSSNVPGLNNAQRMDRLQQMRDLKKKNGW